MATSNGRSAEQVRRDIEAERERLAGAVDDLRAEMDVNTQLKGKVLPAAAAALGIGFVVAGGIGATVRLLMQRREESETKSRFRPFSFVHRD